MADAKKMSVAEMLAAARKADGGGTSEDTAPEQEVSENDVVAAEKSAAKPAAAQPIAKPGSADRPSAADILAMARAGKGGGEKPVEKKPAAKAPAPATKKPAPAKKQPAAPTEPRDTASILASARKSSKPGPMSKSEAAAKSASSPKAPAKAKPKIVVPPMPVKPAYAHRQSAQVTSPKASSKGKGDVDEERRSFLGAGFWALGGVCLIWTLAAVRFMFPNVLREPPSKFKVGFPDAFPAGQVQTKFKAQYGVWVTNVLYDGQQELVALKSVCTHLGCTPSWLEAEQKFKCPCHGSGFYKDGINFEGPAPRPLERYAISIASDGQVEIDKSQTFQEEMGQWSDPACFISV